ncbi:MAG: class I SAM-dependent methyltransferase [Bacilli bacterium]|nr:class I SAM-dependent methyltransferase [Bacilli bacterium]
MSYLSKRLQTIHDMVPNSITADIGSDHGKLMIALFRSGTISKGYAIENKKGPYQRLVRALEQEDLFDHIIPLFSDGVEDLPAHLKTIIYAGMGGENIIDILEKHPNKLKLVQTIIVDAHGAIMKVREKISSLGFVIADEKMVKEEDQYYEIIKFIRADIATYNDKDLEFGPILRNEKSAVFKEKYISRIHAIDELLTKDLPVQRINELKEEKHRIEGIL